MEIEAAGQHDTEIARDIATEYSEGHWSAWGSESSLKASLHGACHSGRGKERERRGKAGGFGWSRVTQVVYSKQVQG